MKLRLSTILILLACALAATTSLTPIVARIKGATPALEEDDRACRSELTTVAKRIADYRLANNGMFPFSLREVGGPFRCPIHKSRLVYMVGPELNTWFRYDAESLNTYRAFARSLSWEGVPVVACISHFDTTNLINVVYVNQGEELPPRPMGVPDEGEEIRILGATLSGQVGYFPAYHANEQAVTAFAEEHLRLRGE